jgi:hypothetical protein
MAQRTARLSNAQLASYARQAGFPEDKIPTIVGIARAESGGNPLALNPNRATGDESYGLMQVNMIDYPDYQLGQSRLREFGLKEKSDLYDPLTNMRAAKAIYDSQGPNAWSVYKSGKYKEFVPGAQELQSTGQSYGGASAAAGGLDMKSGDPKPGSVRSSLTDSILSQSLGLGDKPEVSKKKSLANNLRDSILQSVMQGAVNPFGGGLF